MTPPLRRSPRRLLVSHPLLDDSSSLSLSSTTPRLSPSPRRLRASLPLLDDSASLSLSSMTPPLYIDLSSKIILLASVSMDLSLRPVALLGEIKWKSKAIWADQETLKVRERRGRRLQYK
ncbi:hypothetical protein DY000_02005029 [Brassica cretica]|uniref:Uncharacterized protein n=1 Tax=Brassica cretica TaxID=69181 RepID=A0ABQ7C6N9_BRACR|nr:hypothetical protein DY000_02005029 [Brassica cretica]